MYQEPALRAGFDPLAQSLPFPLDPLMCVHFPHVSARSALLTCSTFAHGHSLQPLKVPLHVPIFGLSHRTKQRSRREETPMPTVWIELRDRDALQRLTATYHCDECHETSNRSAVEHIEQQAALHIFRIHPDGARVQTIDLMAPKLPQTY